MSQDSHPNVARLDRIVTAFNGNNPDVLSTLVTDDFIYRLEGRSPLAGYYEGHDGLRAFMAAIHGACGGTIRVEPIVVAHVGDRWLVMTADVSAERDGRKLVGQNVYVYEFEDGRLRSGRNIPCDAYSWDEFWS